MQPAVGHYGVFNGSRFRSDIVPRIVDFITSYGRTQPAGAEGARDAHGRRADARARPLPLLLQIRRGRSRTVTITII